MKEIKLSKTRSAFVDDEDFESVSKFKWIYRFEDAIRWIGKLKYKRMASEILKPENESVSSGCCMRIRHLDRNFLNNQRANLQMYQQYNR